MSRTNQRRMAHSLSTRNIHNVEKDIKKNCNNCNSNSGYSFFVKSFISTATASLTSTIPRKTKRRATRAYNQPNKLGEKVAL